MPPRGKGGGGKSDIQKCLRCLIILHETDVTKHDAECTGAPLSGSGDVSDAAVILEDSITSVGDTPGKKTYSFNASVLNVSSSSTTYGYVDTGCSGNFSACWPVLTLSALDVRENLLNVSFPPWKTM